MKNLVNTNSRVGLQNENQGSVTRHTYNPNTLQANGIVPVNDLTNGSRPNEQQRFFVDRVSFEQGYDARNDKNYPLRGKVKLKHTCKLCIVYKTWYWCFILFIIKRQGAFVIDQVEPKPVIGTRVRPDSNKSRQYIYLKSCNNS